MIRKIRKIGFKKSAKLLWDRVKRPYIAGYYHRKWKRITRNGVYTGISQEKRSEELVVSLTSFPERINMVHWAIKTLLMQTVKPDRIILWLAKEQFENDILPENLLELQNYGLTIAWYHDIKSYKKLIPTLIQYPEAVIITADDDLYYDSRMVERLYYAYLKDPQYIHCHRISKIYMSESEFEVIAGGYDVYSEPSYLHKLTGGSGTCYPPHSLHPDVLNEALFMQLAPTNDDIWFWAMGVLNGKRCNVVSGNFAALYYVESSQDNALTSINDNGENLFWGQFQNILKYYPVFQERLIEDWKGVSM